MCYLLSFNANNCMIMPYPSGDPLLNVALSFTAFYVGKYSWFSHYLGCVSKSLATLTATTAHKSKAGGILKILVNSVMQKKKKKEKSRGPLFWQMFLSELSRCNIWLMALFQIFVKVGSKALALCSGSALSQQINNTSPSEQSGPDEKSIVLLSFTGGHLYTEHCL